MTTHGLDAAGYVYEVDGDTARPLNWSREYPLAQRDGLTMFCILLDCGTQWDALTKAQRRCLMDPSTRSPRPWATLQSKGYAAGGELTDRGRFVAEIMRKMGKTA